MFGIIYLYKNKLNGKVYIGQTTSSIEFRLKGHLRNKNKCPAIDSALKKYGVENFEIKKIDEAESREELDKKEQYWIQYYHSNKREMGYNLTSGGEHYIANECTRKKQSISQKKRWTDSWRKSFSEMQKNRQKNKENCYWYGKHLTEETKKKLSEKASKRQVGPNNPFYGKHHSEETKQKIKLANTGNFCLGKNPTAKKVRCIETGEIFSCCREASLKYGMHENSLSKLIRLDGGKAKGLHFEYIK